MKGQPTTRAQPNALRGFAAKGWVWRRLACRRRGAAPICFAVEVGLDYGWEPGYGLLRKRSEPPALPSVDALILCQRGVNKLIARHPKLAAEELREARVPWLDLPDELVSRLRQRYLA